jgi:hypothetical protein
MDNRLQHIADLIGGKSNIVDTNPDSLNPNREMPNMEEREDSE